MEKRHFTVFAEIKSHVPVFVDDFSIMDVFLRHAS